MAQPLAEVEIRDETVAVHAEQLSESVAEATWPHILERSPSYERYLRATERTIPLVRLRRLPKGAEVKAIPPRR